MPGFYPLRVSKRGHPMRLLFLWKKIEAGWCGSLHAGYVDQNLSPRPVRIAPVAQWNRYRRHTVSGGGCSKLIAVMKKDKFKGLYGSSVKNNCLCWRSSGQKWSLGSEVEYQPWNLIMKWLRITIRNQLVWDQLKSSQNQIKSLWQQALFFRVQNHQTHCLP